MEKVLIYSFTQIGSKQSVEIKKVLEKDGYSCKTYTVTRFADGKILEALSQKWKEEIGENWGNYDLIFVGAAGIAVRTIAPYIKDKFTDPSVIVIDEKGQFVIPLLSGHVGGAVDFAKKIAENIGAIPVITTATDVQNKFAVDVFAKRNALVITDRKIAKEISAAILEGKPIGFWSEFPVENRMPTEIQRCETRDQLSDFCRGICVCQSVPDNKKNNILYLLPQNLYVGMGCRKGIPESVLLEELEKVLRNNGLWKKQIRSVGSVDIKKEEKGLMELAQSLQVPFLTFTAEELRQTGNDFETSSFVKQITGVDNVCERTARKLCIDGEMLQKKVCMDKCTVAITGGKVSIQF